VYQAGVFSNVIEALEKETFPHVNGNAPYITTEESSKMSENQAEPGQVDIAQVTWMSVVMSGYYGLTFGRLYQIWFTTHLPVLCELSSTAWPKDHNLLV
jgi:hypothetical protein